MNSAEARIVLGACPPGRWPKNDPLVKNARAVAENDRELAEWVRQTRILDAAISSWLRTVAAPASLKAAILAGQRSIRVVERSSGRRAGQPRPRKAVAASA